MLGRRWEQAASEWSTAWIKICKWPKAPLASRLQQRKLSDEGCVHTKRDRNLQCDSFKFKVNGWTRLDSWSRFLGSSLSLDLEKFNFSSDNLSWRGDEAVCCDLSVLKTAGLRTGRHSASWKRPSSRRSSNRRQWNSPSSCLILRVALHPEPMGA